MSKSPPPIPTVAELLADPPLDEPRISVEHTDTRLDITVAEPPASPVYQMLITGLIIFGAAAFICPPLALVAAVLIPLGLLGAGAIYFFAPHLLEPTVDAQQLVISPRTLQLFKSTSDSTSSPTVSYGAHGQRTDPAHITIVRDDIQSVKLLTPSDEKPRGVEITSSEGETILFGTPLVDDDDPTHHGQTPRELQWLFDLLTTHLKIEVDAPKVD